MAERSGGRGQTLLEKRSKKLSLSLQLLYLLNYRLDHIQWMGPQLKIVM